MAYPTSANADAMNDYSEVDPVVLAAALAHIDHHRCDRHMRRTLDVEEVGAPCGSLLRLSPLGKRVAYKHRGRTVVALQCVEQHHGHVLRL